MRLIVAAVLILALAVPAAAATKLRASAPSSSAPGARIAVKVSGPKVGKVRVYVLTRASVRKQDKPAARGSLKRGKATLRVRVPRAARTYRIIACLEKPKLRCAAARKLVVRAPATKLPAPAAPTPTPIATATATPTPTPTPVVEETPRRPPPNPLSVALTPEPAREASQPIGPDGGTVIALSTTGVRYTLTIPAGALPGQETIKLTPAAYSGLPIGAVGGAILEPDGLTFLKDVSLAIRPAGAPDPAQALGFGAEGDGEEVHLARTAVSGGEIHVTLRHFSFAGAGNGGAAAVRALLEAAPTGEQDLAVHEIAAATLLHARGEATAAELDAAVRGALRRWRLASVEPNLRAAETDDAGFDEATADFIAWQAELARSGLDLSADLDRLIASHKRAAVLAFERAFVRCVTHGEYERMGRMLLIQQIDQQLGYGVVDSERLVRCGRFKVERHVTFSHAYGAYILPGVWESTAGGISYQTDTPSIPIVYSPGDPELRATGPLAASAFTVTGSQIALGANCDQTWVVTGIDPPGTVTLAVDLPVNLNRRHVVGTLPPTAVRTAAIAAPPLRYDLVLTKEGQSCGQGIIPSVYPSHAGAARVPIADDDTGAVVTVVNGTTGGAGQYTDTVDTRVELTHTPCPAATPLPDCA